MTQRATIAVVIPLYNKGPHIERALDSALAQTSPADEIIVVDDTSSDDGPQRVARYDDPRIKLIHRDQPGPGGYAARNVGIAEAKSEWIAFLDADDAWLPHALAQARLMIEQADDKVSCLFNGYASDYGDGKLDSAKLERATGSGKVKRLSLDPYLEAWLSLSRSPMWTSAVVARRRSLVEAGLFPAGKCSRGGDKDTWLRLLTVGDALEGDAVTAIYHRDSVNMVTRSISTNRRPYLCGTLEGLLPTPDPARDTLVRRLINAEMYWYAQETWRRRSRIDPAIFEGFIVQQNPRMYMLLRALAGAPDWLLGLTYKARDLRASVK